MRLRIDYDSFLSGDFDTCLSVAHRKLHCIISYINEKSKMRRNGDFHRYYDKFIEDFTHIYWALIEEIPQAERKTFGQ